VTPDAQPARDVAPAPPPKRAGAAFLSFAMPQARFRFDEPQQYTLLPELCRVGFDAKSTLHDFSGVTSQVRGGFRADLDDPDGAWTGDVSATAASLRTGVDGRDENMREHLDAKTHADIRFVVERFHPAAGGVDVAKQTLRGDVAGTMTIRGVSRPFRMPIHVEVDPQQRVVLTGQAPLKLGDYGVPVPSQLGLINMQEEVVVWIALRARAAAGAGK
jgi:polyisoprenoid-binding protein YceI